jgi:hypothetical protein
MGEYGTLFGVVAFLAVFAAVALHARSLWSMSKNREQAKVEEGWEARQRALALQLVRIGPQPAAKKYGGDSRENLYLTIFTDPQFRALLERHVIEVDRKRGEFVARRPRPAQIREPLLRETVARGEEIIEAYRQAHPAFAEENLG